MSIAPYIEGLGLGASLIVAIGAQNAFVLRQGLRRQHTFVTASICALCDIALISLGVAGLGAVIARAPSLLAIATWGGAAFLFAFGLRSFLSALRPGALSTDAVAGEAGRTVRSVVLTTLGLSLLNPHVYLDTVVLFGSIGARHPVDERLGFALGAITASLLWFFGLSYGAALLAPFFRRPATWCLLDAAVGCVMWAIAVGLVLPQVG
ncbi:MAG: LysE/ArgO family amino acid transporter [Anaerolineae bacterium]